MAARTIPSGPKGHFLSGNLREFNADPLGFLTTCARDFGDVVALRFGRQSVLLLNHPRHVEYVLTAGQSNFTKGFNRAFSPILGDGLFTSEGEIWLRQRRLVQPAFQRDRIAVHGEILMAHIQKMLMTWRDGETRDIHAEMMRLMLGISAHTILGIDNPAKAERVGDALETAVACIDGRSSRWQWLPGFRQRRLRSALRQLDAMVYESIGRARCLSDDRSDVLATLLHMRSPQAGSEMTDFQARDQVINLFIAGRETTALALSWTWHLLAHHPEQMAELEQELQDVLGGRAPTVADLPRLHYAEQVVLESLRLFPPAFALGRTAIRACEIGGYDVPAGTRVLLSQWISHRDARYFDQPNRFQPNRWANGMAQRLPRFAFFPFGGGARLCIGSALAMMNIVLALCTIAQKFRLVPAPGFAVMIWPNVTLRPKAGIKVILQARQPGEAIVAARVTLDDAEGTENADDPCILFHQGRASLARGRADEAVPLLQRSLELAAPEAPYLRQVWVALVEAEIRLGKKSDAVASLRSGMSLFPGDSDLLFMEGILSAEKGDLATAESCFVRVVGCQGFPDSGQSHPEARGYLGRHYLAGVYCAQGRLADAENEWIIAITDRPNFTPAWRGLGELYADQSRWDDFGRVIEKMTANPAMQLDGIVLQAEGHLAQADYPAAQHSLRVAIDLAPDAAWPRELLDRALLEERKNLKVAKDSESTILAD